MAETGEGEEDSQNRTKADEGEEVSVIAPPYAVIDPHTVVILRLYAIIANSAVVAARGAPDVTGLAILGRDIHGSGLHGGRLHHSPLSSWRA